ACQNVRFPWMEEKMKSATKSAPVSLGHRHLVEETVECWTLLVGCCAWATCARPECTGLPVSAVFLSGVGVAAMDSAAKEWSCVACSCQTTADPMSREYAGEYSIFALLPPQPTPRDGRPPDSVPSI